MELKDDQSFMDLLIACLQGFYAVVKINKNALATNNQDNFHWFSKEERSRANIPVSPLNVTAPVFFPKRHSGSVPPEGSLDKPMRSFYEPKYFQERMTRKMRGSGDFINWIHDKSFSMYQNSFASRINNNPTQVAKPANSSTVIRVLPINSINR